MKVFFITAIQGKKEYQDAYESIVSDLEEQGAEVTSDYLLTFDKSDLQEWQTDEVRDLHKRVLRGMKNADIVVVEASFQRTSTGYWISKALDFGKPTIVLYQQGKRFSLLDTLSLNDRLIEYEYRSLDDLTANIPNFIAEAGEKQDTRFNFFISPRHTSYLDWISKNERIPRSVYLRRIIKRKMEEDEDYQERFSV